MKVIELEQAIASEIVGRLRNIGLQPLVAGGAPRSWYLGEACNDIDVFVEMSSDNIRDVEAALGIPLELKGKDYQTATGLLLAVFEGDFQGKKVQIMCLDMPPYYYVHNRFPFTLCKFWFEDGEIKSTWDARLSLEEQVFIEMEEGKYQEGYLIKLSKQLRIPSVTRSGWASYFRRPPLRVPAPPVGWFDDAIPDENADERVVDDRRGEVDDNF